MFRQALYGNKFLYTEASDPAGGDPAPGAGGAPAPDANQAPSEGTETPDADAPSDYGFGDPPADDEQEKETVNEPDLEEGAPFELAFDEAIQMPDDLKDLLTTQAKESGLPADKASAFLNSIVSKLDAAEVERAKESDQSLRSDWGRDYEANVKQAKAFAHKVAKSSGLSLDDLSPLQSPKGFRLLHAISGMVGERRAEGIQGAAVATSDPKDEAKRILTDPTHKFHRAIMNPSDPQHIEANNYYDSLMGIK